MKLEKIFIDFLNNNIEWIKEIILDYGKYGYKDVLYDQEEFEQMVLSCNQDTEEEQGYVNGWTDDKDELFNGVLDKFVKDQNM
jgi:hypothetical protein